MSVICEALLPKSLLISYSPFSPRRLRPQAACESVQEAEIGLKLNAPMHKA